MTNNGTPKRIINCTPQESYKVDLLKAHIDLAVVQWVLSGEPNVEDFLDDLHRRTPRY